MLLIMYVQQHFLSRKVETIPYGQFKQEPAQDNVDKLTVGPEKARG
jgi:hypothetical protein